MRAGKVTMWDPGGMGSVYARPAVRNARTSKLLHASYQHVAVRDAAKKALGAAGDIETHATIGRDSFLADKGQKMLEAVKLGK